MNTPHSEARLGNISRGAEHAVSAPALDVARIRADFPILKLQVHGKPLVYVDNAASSQIRNR